MLKSIRGKILLAILAVTMFTACSITVVFYLRAAGMIEEDYSGLLYGRMQQTVKDMDESLKEIYYVDTRAAWDENLRKNAEAYIRTGNERFLEKVAEVLRSHSREYKNINSLYFVFSDKKMAVTSEEFPVSKQNLDGTLVKKLEEKQEEDSFPVLVESVIHEGESFLSVLQKVENDNGDILGYVAADIKERTIYYEYLEAVNDEKITRVLLVDGNNEIVTSAEYSDLGKTFAEITDHNVPDDNGYSEKDGVLSFFSRGSFSDCGLYLEVPKKEVLSGLSQIRLFLIGIFGTFFVVAVLLALWLSRVVCEPLRSMTGTVEKVGEGDLSLRTEVVTADEIGTLGKEFNHMLDYIEDLIAKVIEEEQQKKDAELEALQYQITPHFMYNTLNSIKFAAFLKGEKELAGLIGDFVELLQASINKKGSFLSVADEIHILKNYIHLQDFRYQGSFQVEYDISEEAYSCYIPRLILQPLVENALLHGIDIKRQKGKIRICGKIEEERLILVVADNGRGMTEEQIRNLFNSHAKKTNGLSAVGVPNVKERLELYYGEKGGMKYDSSSGGTTVTVFLPAIYDIPEEGRKN
ncbi:MAG: sensor histidine kinase [Eubacteriales bacterium]|nr:sensor histidine kinase [Eubacteriales bacterium]